MVRWLPFVFLLGLGCGTPDDPSKTGYRVGPDSACHEQLKLQCQCCEDGEPNCTAWVGFLVKEEKAWTNATPTECQALIDQASPDMAVFCATFDTHQKLQVACQNFPPGSGPKPDEPDATGP